MARETTTTGATSSSLAQNSIAIVTAVHIVPRLIENVISSPDNDGGGYSNSIAAER